MGSGTTAIAAETLGRNWIGIELNPTYAEEAIIRIKRKREQGCNLNSWRDVRASEHADDETDNTEFFKQSRINPT
jgi:hypothetical protein